MKSRDFLGAAAAQPGEGHVRGEFAALGLEADALQHPLLRRLELGQGAVDLDAGIERARLVAAERAEMGEPDVEGEAVAQPVEAVARSRRRPGRRRRR